MVLKLMKKCLLIVLLILLTGCATTVPITTGVMISEEPGQGGNRH